MLKAVKNLFQLAIQTIMSSPLLHAHDKKLILIFNMISRGSPSHHIHDGARDRLSPSHKTFIEF